MRFIFKKVLCFALAAALCLSLSGCFSADNLASDNSSTLPGDPINLYTSRDVNRFIKDDASGRIVVDQYGQPVADCSVDVDGNILLNGRVIVKSDSAERYFLPRLMLVGDTTIDVVAGIEFLPEVVFFPEDTACKEFKVEVIDGEYTTNDKGNVVFTHAGIATCKIISVANNELIDTCTVTIYASTEELPKYENIKEFGTNYLGTVFDIDEDIYLDWVNLHLGSSYYLGTEYDDNDARRPNGDTPEGKKPGMNCTGFVWHLLSYTAGMSHSEGATIPGMTGWYNMYTTYDVKRYVFQSKEDMLASGKLEKGDIIWIWDQNGENSRSDTHHIGVYVGDGYTDIFWHSLNGADFGYPMDGNMITHIGSIAQPSRYVVLDMYK
ncbi:MAG: hypothetical protein IIW23_03700 [Clostridia bacterium]|nr:hypothetical protein [Clostridia bacterium]